MQHILIIEERDANEVAIKNKCPEKIIFILIRLLFVQ